MFLCRVAAEGVASAAPPKRVNKRAEEAGLGTSGCGVCSECVLFEETRPGVDSPFELLKEENLAEDSKQRVGSWLSSRIPKGQFST